MRIYALVEFCNMTVANVETRSSAPPAPPGFRIIVDSDWAEGQIAAIGHIWDDKIPASFAPPAIEDVPADAQEAETVAAVRDAQAEIDRRLARMEALLGIEGA